MTAVRVPLWIAEAWGLVPVELTPEDAAIRTLLYICAAGLCAEGLLVLVASLWEWYYMQAAESRRLARAVARAMAADEARTFRAHIGAPQDEHGIITAAVPGD